MDEWDSVSDETPPDGATDTWDAISTPERPSAPAQKRLPPDNLVIEGDEFQSTNLPDQIMPVMGSSQEPQLNTPAMSFPARSERIAMPPSTTVRPIHVPSRYKQMTRDILSLLIIPIPLLLGWRLYLLVRSSSIPTWLDQSGLLALILLLLSYAIGILAAAISGRKGFDVLFPVLIGCIVGFISFFAFLPLWGGP